MNRSFQSTSCHFRLASQIADPGGKLETPDNANADARAMLHLTLEDHPELRTRIVETLIAKQSRLQEQSETRQDDNPNGRN